MHGVQVCAWQTDDWQWCNAGLCEADCWCATRQRLCVQAVGTGRWSLDVCRRWQEGQKPSSGKHEEDLGDLCHWFFRFGLVRKKNQRSECSVPSPFFWTLFSPFEIFFPLLSNPSPPASLFWEPSLYLLISLFNWPLPLSMETWDKYLNSQSNAYIA